MYSQYDRIMKLIWNQIPFATKSNFTKYVACSIKEGIQRHSILISSVI